MRSLQTALLLFAATTLGVLTVLLLLVMTVQRAVGSRRRRRGKGDLLARRRGAVWRGPPTRVREVRQQDRWPSR